MEYSDRLYTTLARETAQRSADAIQQLSDPKALKSSASADATHKRTLPPKVDIDAIVSEIKAEDDC